MSVHTDITPVKMKLVKFGKITIGDQRFDLLTQPLTREKKDWIYLYKKIHRYIKVTTPWGNDFYEWTLEDNKLYLTGIYFQKSKSLNFIAKIFKKERLEANWLNGKVKVLIKKVGDVGRIGRISTLEFKNGQCVAGV